jgi:peptidoglycan/xylan/chitin deacetylase (PgdA/CDA1 family)
MKKSFIWLIISLIFLGLISFFGYGRQTQLFYTSMSPVSNLNLVKSETKTVDIEPSLKLNPTYFYAPIINYHHIAKVSPEQSYYVSPEILNQQMSWLVANDYHFVAYDELYQAMIGKTTLPSKPVIVSLDDGDADQYTNALPIFEEYHVPAIFFIISARVGQPGYMTWDQIKELSVSGMTIGSHGVNHDDMANMDEINLKLESEKSKQILEQNLGVKINFFAYPGGANSKQTIQAMKNAGYLSAVTTRHSPYQSIKNPDDLYRVPRLHIDDEMPSFISWVKGNSFP